LKEQQHHEHPEKSAVAKHSINLGHSIQPHNTSILATKTGYVDHIIREVTEIELQSNNMNRMVSV
jgi:hypothetical protein